MAWQASPLPHQVYNIGTGEMSTGEDVVAAIQQSVPDAKFELTPGPNDDAIINQRAQFLDLTRTREELGFTSEYDLNAGIADYVREMRAVL